MAMDRMRPASRSQQQQERPRCEAAQAHGQKAILRQCQLAIAAAKESCGAALNRINNLTLFLLFLAHCFVWLQSLFLKPTRPALFVNPHTADGRRSPSLQAADQITAHHGRQRHPGLCPSPGCSPDYAIQCRPYTKGPGTRVPRTVSEICMRLRAPYAVQQTPTNKTRTKHGTRPS
jgi:hypothetical protein